MLETFTKGLTVVFALYAFISVALGIQNIDRLSWESSALLLFLVTEFLQGILLLTSKRVKIPVQNPMNLLPPVILAFLTIVAGGEALQTMKQSPIGHLGAFLFYLGLMGSFLATVSIGRSFGVFAEVREIQMTGIYQWVRHPIYSSYFLQYTGVALVSNSLFTTSLLVAAAFLQILRAIQEEQVLMQDEEYRKYTLRTGRFFPRFLKKKLKIISRSPFLLKKKM